MASYKEDVVGCSTTEDDGVVFIESEYVSGGRFPRLEAELVALKIPFDRISSGYFEIQPEERRYRPAADGTGEIDVTQLF